MPDDLRAKIKSLMPQAQAELAHMVSIPSVADPDQYPAEKCLEMAEWVRDQIAAAGIQDARLVDPPDGHPAVFGHTPGPPGSPTVLLYSHYDVQPPLGEDEWISPPWQMVERGGRWYGRGTADCKGNIALHLLALRALGGADFPLGIKFICEGAEEQGTGGLEEFVAANGELFESDVVLVVDTGNSAVGIPTLTTGLRGLADVIVRVKTLDSAMHSGIYGGAAPDALQALIRLLATLRDDAGHTTIDGLQNDQHWEGDPYDPQQFREEAHVLDGVDLIGGDVADALWARPALTVLGIDCPPVVGSSSSIPPEAAARLNLRVPPGTDALQAQDALVAHLQAHAPWGVELEVERQATGSPFSGKLDGPGTQAMSDALAAAYGKPTTTQGQGGSIPLCSVFHETLDDPEVILMGVEDPLCLIHAPNESVDPTELENMALAEAIFLQDYAQSAQSSSS